MLPKSPGRWQSLTDTYNSMSSSSPLYGIVNFTILLGRLADLQSMIRERKLNSQCVLGYLSAIRTTRCSGGYLSSDTSSTRDEPRDRNRRYVTT